MTDVPRLVAAGRKAYSRLSTDEAMQVYFDMQGKRKDAWKAKDISALLRWAMGSLPLTEKHIKHAKSMDRITKTKTENVYDESISYACRFLPQTGQRGQLENVRELVDFFPELHIYRSNVQLAFESIETIKAIRQHLITNPGTKQNTMKKALNYEDGRHLSLLIKDMEIVGHLERRKSGNTYELHLKEKAVQKTLPEQPQEGDPRKVEDVPTVKANPKKKLFSSWWKRG